MHPSGGVLHTVSPRVHLIQNATHTLAPPPVTGLATTLQLILHHQQNKLDSNKYARNKWKIHLKQGTQLIPVLHGSLPSLCNVLFLPFYSTVFGISLTSLSSHTFSCYEVPKPSSRFHPDKQAIADASLVHYHGVSKNHHQALALLTYV